MMLGREALRHGPLVHRLGSHGLLHLRRLNVRLLRVRRKLLVLEDLSSGTMLIVIQRLTELVDLLLLLLHLRLR